MTYRHVFISVMYSSYVYVFGRDGHVIAKMPAMQASGMYWNGQWYQTPTRWLRTGYEARNRRIKPRYRNE